MTADFDLVVRGGNIADGAGGALHEGDVAVKGGTIAAVGKVSGKGAEEIDARGKLVRNSQGAHLLKHLATLMLRKAQH
jgi:N-acyl-D-aspartate/D-glutamate deacylase